MPFSAEFLRKKACNRLFIPDTISVGSYESNFMGHIDERDRKITLSRICCKMPIYGVIGLQGFKSLVGHSPFYTSNPEKNILRDMSGQVCEFDNTPREGFRILDCGKDWRKNEHSFILIEDPRKFIITASTEWLVDVCLGHKIGLSSEGVLQGRFLYSVGPKREILLVTENILRDERFGIMYPKDLEREGGHLEPGTVYDAIPDLNPLMGYGRWLYIGEEWFPGHELISYLKRDVSDLLIWTNLVEYEKSMIYQRISWKGPWTAYGYRARVDQFKKQKKKRKKIFVYLDGSLAGTDKPDPGPNAGTPTRYSQYVWDTPIVQGDDDSPIFHYHMNNLNPKVILGKSKDQSVCGGRITKEALMDSALKTLSRFRDFVDFMFKVFPSKWEDDKDDNIDKFAQWLKLPETRRNATATPGYPIKSIFSNFDPRVDYAAKNDIMEV